MPALGLIEVSGSPYEAGQALGRFGAPAVQGHLLRTAAWHEVMQWRGSPMAAAMTQHVQQRFPRIWSELQGLADGLRVPFEDVFLWNCRGDLWAASPDGCTTVLLPSDLGTRIAHNEDGDPGFAGHCAIAECRIDGSPGFAAFVYPGSLPGHTFAVTEAGLAVTVNNLRQRGVDAGVPRMVLTRAVLDATTLDAALTVLRDSPRAGGFHLTLGHRVRAGLLSVEYSSHGCSVREIGEPSLHANHAIHPAMSGFAQRVTASSRDRQRRGDTLLNEAREAGRAPDPLAILADTHEASSLPIYRAAPDDPDGENTLATADIVIRASHIEWDVYEQPGTPPRYRFIDGHRQTQHAPQGRE
ncbi:C45 family peptidase [Paraburkholderia phymatum]|uniref:Peptidase C45 acyl-coenzyme A:6-aminopenicillanic acid acyl-transferase n=1 Tax=Paraburkholderia phymatum (strain DSM 17167 / CIP 108236 / LMG 21445 / STM815) TaxID=391038 RepID=B2JHA4_PARP8|nr:C45 family peptidase [Paraburkholderia phymatum]ACC70342.1 peptidase C45 acyl-coenzyme A:6-aminopenicillanic acid acyl-transferase [Paraburkholderia phymatum STM815]